MIPKQYTGAKSNTSHTIKAGTSEQAKILFEKACNNLLNVNNWQHLSGGGLSASFELIDENGEKINRPAKKGDYFRINIPAPGNESGDGYDWVKIENIENKPEEAGTGSLTIQVRAAQHPMHVHTDSSHFFTSDATSNFQVQKHGRAVTASVHGRNEKPNARTGGWLNNIRNIIIGFLAMLGMNKPQRKALAKGILEKEV